MGWFSSKSAVRTGIVVDIGSGSVMVSIVRSDPKLSHPIIVWSRREQASLKQRNSNLESANHVMGAFLNAMLYIDGEGLKTLKERFPGSKITGMQVAVAAPWSYTITKSISYTDKTDFIITKHMVEELVEAAQKKTMEELKENEIANSLGLTIMTRATTNISANQYPTEQPFGQKAKSLSLTHVSAVAQESLVRMLSETKNKVIPEANLKNFSFMLIYFSVMREIFDAFTDYCLIDVTNEATEMGVIRDGSLQYSTHVSFGAATLAREIASDSGIPIEEAYSYLKNSETRARVIVQNPKLKNAFASASELYRKNLTELFSETGDRLSVPKSIFIHTDLFLEPYFKDEVVAAAKQATKMDHIVHQVTDQILLKHYDEAARTLLSKRNTDTALLLSALFFHRQNLGTEFEHDF